MAKRPTISDLAAAAGVSVATVDRILNGRQKVRETTVERVAATAEQIGYYAAGLIRRRARESLPRRTLGFLLQRPDSFYRQLATDLTIAVQASTAIQGRSMIEFNDDLEPAAIARCLIDIGARVDAVAVVALEHPQVNEAIANLRANGLPVFTLLSDVTAPERSGHIGVDPRKAGRSAAWTITRCSHHAGPVGILIGSHKYLGQALAEISFRSYLRELAPQFVPLEPLVNFDDPRVAFEATIGILDGHPDLAALYNAGGGMAGMIDAIRLRGAGDRVAAVCNELIPETRAALIDGSIDLVLATPTKRIAEIAVDAMVSELTAAGTSGPRHLTVAADLMTPENI